MKVSSPAQRLSILGFAAAVLALAGLVMTDSAFGTGPISIGLQVAAALFMIWARITFGRRSFHAAASATDGELVTSGPYAFVRNPIYAAVILFAWTGAAVHFSWKSAMLGAIVFAGMFLRILMEERSLRATYRDYDAYAKRVKRLVPFVF